MDIVKFNNLDTYYNLRVCNTLINIFIFYSSLFAIFLTLKIIQQIFNLESC